MGEKMKFIAILFALASLAVNASVHITSTEGYAIDERETIGDINLVSGSDEEYRVYQAVINREYNAPIEMVVKHTLNFDEKCNNKYKRRRKITDRNSKCRFHNHNLVESIIIRDIKKTYQKEQNEIDRFIVQREIYNRGRFHHNDLVVVKNWKNEKGQEVVTVSHSALHDNEAKQYLKNPVEFNSAFVRMTGYYTFTAISPTKTKVEYKYTSKTDHWLLTKSMIVGKVFDNMAKGTGLALDVIKTANQEALASKSK
jgi:hypothetical protein